MTRWWRSHSVRVRLTLWYVTAMLVILGIYAAVVFGVVRRSASQALDQQLRDGPGVLDRLAQVAPRELPQVEPELDGDRLVQPVAADEVVADRIGRALAQDRPAGVARHDPGQGEDEEDEPEQDRDRHQEAADDEAGHGVTGAPILRSV